MVRRTAREVWRRLPASVELDDLVTAGTIGLLEAADRYDAALGVPFAGFARHRVRGAILDALRAEDWVPKGVRQRAHGLEQARAALTAHLGRPATDAEVASALDLPVESVRRDLASPEGLRSTDGFEGPAVPPSGEEAVTWGRVLQAVAELPERERVAIEMFYLEDRPLKEIAPLLGVTLPRVTQLCARGLERLREALRAE